MHNMKVHFIRNQRFFVGLLNLKEKKFQNNCDKRNGKDLSAIVKQDVNLIDL